MLYYFDTSALVKLYHEEKGSEKVKFLYEDLNAENCISQLTYTEFYSTLYKKLRTREIENERVIQEVIKSFEIDMQYEWVIEVDENIFRETRNIISKYAADYSIRTLDAIHLACAGWLAETDETIFISSDKTQLEVAYTMGLDVINPEDPDQRIAEKLVVMK